LRFSTTASTPISSRQATAAMKVPSPKAKLQAAMARMGEKRPSTTDDDTAEKRSRHETEAARLCPIDGNAVKPGKRYCNSHHTCHDCIRRRAEKGCDFKAKPPVITEQMAAYKQIFGDRANMKDFPGDPRLADEIVAKFEEDFPPTQKCGKLRGDVDLTQYVLSKGVQKYVDTNSSRPKWDKELFVTQICSLRGWTNAKALATWAEMQAAGSHP